MIENKDFLIDEINGEQLLISIKGVSDVIEKLRT